MTLRLCAQSTSTSTEEACEILILILLCCTEYESEWAGGAGVLLNGADHPMYLPAFSVQGGLGQGTHRATP